MDSNLLTIIIPTFNADKTIEDCLDSIVIQTFSNFEILVLDALSSDKTVSIVKEYASRYPYIKYISESDGGIYDAMNKGINLSQGNWLYFLGCDDKLYNDEVLQKIFSIIKEEPNLDVIYGNVLSERFKGVYNGEYNNRKILHQNICHQAIFFSKNLFSEVGNFNLKYKAQADWDHNLKWFLDSKIERMYVDILIAYYADGGFSSVQGDDIFYYDKRLNYVRYGKESLSWGRRFFVLIIDFLKAFIRWNLQKMRLLVRNIFVTNNVE